MVLFDVLRKKPEVELVVTHVDHGIRDDSHKDQQLVRSIAMSHNIPYETTQLSLGPQASEEMARELRYDFLRHICNKYNVVAMITAHHQDDLLETVIINIVRGTGWRGLASLRSTSDILRPLLHVPKADILQYAQNHGIVWREDPTNADQSYLRNRVRHAILAKASRNWRDNTLRIIVRQNQNVAHIDNEASRWLTEYATDTEGTTSLSRYQLSMIPYDVAHELLQTLLRRKIGKSIERPLMQKALLFCKVAKSGKVFQMSRGWQLRVTQKDVIVEAAPGMVS